MINKGDKVVVKAFPNKQLERRVVDTNNQTVIVCNEEEYYKALKEHREPSAIGFPIEDVIEIKNDKKETA